MTTEREAQDDGLNGARAIGWVVVFWLAALFACFVGSARAEKIKPTRGDFAIALQVQYLSRQQAWDYCKSLGLWPDVQVMPKYGRKGCNLYHQDKKLCVVVTPPPAEVDDDATLNLGHEVDHCLRGDYHK